MMWPHPFRYNLKKWLDRYKLLQQFQEDINKYLCYRKLPEFKKPVSSQCFEVYFISFAPLYRIIFVLCSLLALATSGYFYCCCILYVFLKNDVLHHVLTAVRRSGRSPKVHVHVYVIHVYMCNDTYNIILYIHIMVHAKYMYTYLSSTCTCMYMWIASIKHDKLHYEYNV